MAVTKLSLYNDALLLIGERKLSSDTEDTPTRHALDTAYDDPAAADYCLELTKPKFALLTGKLASPATPTNHTLQYEYSLPADYISFYNVFSDSELDEPINRYLIEGRTIACDYATNIYLRYVSNAQALTVWTPLFAEVVVAFLAKKIAPRFAPQKLAGLEKLFVSRVQTTITLEGIKEETPRPQEPSFTLTDDYRNIYNGALNLLGERQIISNDDDSERRSALDTVIDSGAVNYLYELVKPKFALETNKLTTSVASTEHDLDNVFTLPSDYLCIVEIHASALMDEPINRYLIEGRTLACEYSTIYLRFVSSSPATTDWTTSYKQLLSAYLADQLKNRFVKDADVRESIAVEYGIRLKFVTTKEGYKEPKERATRDTATLSDTWRKVYNHALLIMGLPKIVANDDDSIRRVELDNALGTGIVETALEDLGWTFALKSEKVTFNPSLEPEWGYIRVFNKPIDMHRLNGIYSDEHFQSPLVDYQDEGDKWFTHIDDIYIQYVKTSFLTSPDSWPQYFANVVAARLADLTCTVLKGDRKNTNQQVEKIESEAESTDAMRGPPQPIHTGRWVRSRFSGRSGYDRLRP